MLPEPLEDAAARMVASPRLYNITISNVPGPRVPLYLAGVEVLSISPVIPITDLHALSIGVLAYRGGARFACYVDPEALRGVEALAVVLEEAVLELEAAFEGTAGIGRS
jgi:hypothetical protein